jgi:hypothetical protein
VDVRPALLRFLIGCTLAALGAWMIFLRAGAPGAPRLGAPQESAGEQTARPNAVPGPAPAEAPATTSQAPALPLRGRVVDATTGEPVAALRVVAGAFTAFTAADGRFDAGAPLSAETTRIEVLDDVLGAHLATLDLAALALTPEGLLLPVEIGPTYRLNPIGISADELAGWRGRLVELGASGDEILGTLVTLHAPDAGAPPFLRLERPWRPNDLGSTFRVELVDALGTRAGASERLNAARGIYPGLVRVRLDRVLSCVAGRVIDPVGTPEVGASVTALSTHTQRADGAWPACMTDAQGRFTLGELPPDRIDLLVRSRLGERWARRSLILPEGSVPLDDIVLEAASETVELHGRLEGRSAEPRGEFLLRLRPQDGSPSILARCSAPTFRLEHLPARDWILSVIDPEGTPWTPAVLLADPPWEELVFVREDETPREQLVFDARDAASGEPLEELQVLLQVGPRWNSDPVLVRRGEPCASVPRGAAFRFSAWADGYRSVYGGQEDFEASGGPRRARLALARGFGARLQFRDLGPGFEREDPFGRLATLERPGVAGVEVWIDGSPTATSDELGVALLELEREPESLSAVAPGWRVVGSDRLRAGRLDAGARDVVVWLVRQ